MSGDAFKTATELGKEAIVGLLAVVEVVPVIRPLAMVLKLTIEQCDQALFLKSAAKKFAVRLEEIDSLVQTVLKTCKDSELIEKYANRLIEVINKSHKYVKPLGDQSFVFQLFNCKKTERKFNQYDLEIANIMRDLTMAVGLAQYEITAKVYEIVNVEKFIIDNGGVEAVLKNEGKVQELASELDCPVEVVQIELNDQWQRIKNQIDVMHKDLREELKKLQEELKSPTVDLPLIGMDALVINKDCVLGEGEFGCIYGGVYMNEDVTVKTLKKEVAGHLTGQEVETLKKEVKTLFILGKYPGFVHLYGANLTPAKGEPCIVLERADGSLDDILHTNKLQVDLSFALKASIAMDIARAMSVLHQMELIYRDLNPQNVLIFFKGKERRVVAKLTNFGLAKGAAEQASVGAMKGIVKSTTPYGAPELFQAITSSGVPYSFASDVYALGITLNEMMTEDIPFQGFKGSEGKLIDHIKAGNCPNLFKSSSEDIPVYLAMEKIIKSCLHLNPVSRPRMSVIVEDLQRVCEAGLEVVKQGLTSDSCRQNVDLQCSTDKRKLQSLNHEECIFLFEHLSISDARTMLKPDITGEHLAAIKENADFKNMGIESQMKDLIKMKSKIKILMESGIDKSVLDERRSQYVRNRALQKGVPPLLLAFEEGDYEAVAIFAKEKEDVNRTTEDGLSLLHVAAFKGQEQMVSTLIELGADLSAKTSNGSTALHLAAQKGHYNVVDYLLGKEINAKEPNSDGLSAMILAHLEGHDDIVSLIQERVYGKVPLKDLSDSECVELLSSLGCTVNESESDLAELLEAIILEENEEDREVALSELGEWAENTSMKEISAKLRTMYEEGVDQGPLVFAKEKRESEGKKISS